MKRWIGAAASAAILLSASVAAAASAYPNGVYSIPTTKAGYVCDFPKVKVTVNGQALSTGKVPAILYDGQTLVPVSALAKALGGSVTWSGKTYTAAVTAFHATPVLTAAGYFARSNPILSNASAAISDAMHRVIAWKTGAPTATDVSALSADALAVTTDAGDMTGIGTNTKDQAQVALAAEETHWLSDEVTLLTDAQVAAKDYVAGNATTYSSLMGTAYQVTLADETAVYGAMQTAAATLQAEE